MATEEEQFRTFMARIPEHLTTTREFATRLLGPDDYPTLTAEINAVAALEERLIAVESALKNR